MTLFVALLLNAFLAGSMEFLAQLSVAPLSPGLLKSVDSDAAEVVEFRKQAIGLLRFLASIHHKGARTFDGVSQRMEF